MTTARKIKAFDIQNHGTDHPDYFQGAGVSFTEYEDAVTGTGADAKEAYENAAEQLASWGKYDVSGLPTRPTGIRKRDRLTCECRGTEECEHWVHVTIRVR